jgi:hypothetical protein
MTSLSQSVRSIDAKLVPNYGWRWRVQVIAEKTGLGKCVGEKKSERLKNASAASGKKRRVMMTIPHSLTWKFATLQKIGENRGRSGWKVGSEGGCSAREVLPDKSLRSRSRKGINFERAESSVTADTVVNWLTTGELPSSTSQ